MTELVALAHPHRRTGPHQTAISDELADTLGLRIAESLKGTPGPVNPYLWSRRMKPDFSKQMAEWKIFSPKFFFFRSISDRDTYVPTAATPCMQPIMGRRTNE
jgi:hypothetical protein